MKNYYSLLGREEINGPLVILFGDYNEDTVKQEQRDLKDSGEPTPKGMRIVLTDHAQAAITAKLEELNADHITVDGIHYTVHNMDDTSHSEVTLFQGATRIARALMSHDAECASWSNIETTEGGEINYWEFSKMTDAEIGRWLASVSGS